MHPVNLPKVLISLFRIKISFIFQIFTLLFLAFCIALLGAIHVVWLAETQDKTFQEDIEKFGYLGFTVLICLKLIPCLSTPFAFMNLLALLCTNLWPDLPKLEVPRTYIPFICFRVVTRGLYKNLVVNSLQRNLKICQRAALERFQFEVVTDIPLDLKPSIYVRETVVPKKYATKNNSLYKARALNYCLEKGIDHLSGNDWIVHLDEETLLTEGSLIGLVNFAAKELGSVGQGVITYANDGIINWWTTLADSVRVGIDVGLMKFCFQKLHRPLYGLKGSFIVVKASAEKAIGFDFGPNGSIAEDLYFALEAWKKGYKFNFVDGEMCEKSPFTIFDYIQQRKRWFVGRMYTLLSKHIPIKYKLLLIPTDFSWLLLGFNLLNLPLSFIFPVMTSTFIICINSFVGGIMIFLFTFGSIKSFSMKRYGLIRKLMICILTILIIPCTACLDGIASLYGFCWKMNDGFYIVKKEHDLHLKNVPDDI